MATISRPNDFTDGTPAVAAEVDEDFNTLYDFVQDSVVHTDAANSFTNTPSGPASDPTTANQLTRKSYVDDKAGGVKTAWVKTKDSSGSDATLKGSLAASAQSDAVSDLTIAASEVSGHWYRATFHVPEIWINKDTAFGVQPRVAVEIKRAGALIARHWVEHQTDDGGYGATIVTRPMLAASSASRDWEVYVRNGWTSEANVRYKADTTYPMSFHLEDLGTGVA